MFESSSGWKEQLLPTKRLCLHVMPGTAAAFWDQLGADTDTCAQKAELRGSEENLEVSS